MENILETKHLSKKYRGQCANDDISITVKRNIVYGLLGPNGAGKSTLLKALTGMIIPTSGEIIFDGRAWSRRELAAIGALIESPPLYENLTARENLKVRTLLYGLPESRIDEVLEMVALTDTGRKRAGHFSMGMKHPKLLILDEPTNGLDPIGIGDLRRMIRSFPEQGITVILSSHMLSEVQQTADEIGIIANGKLWYEAPVCGSEDLETLFLEVVQHAGEDPARRTLAMKGQVV